MCGGGGGGEGELKAVYGCKKKTIFQELALYQSESTNFWVSGLFMEWFSKAKSLTQKTRTKYPNESVQLYICGEGKKIKKDELLVVIFATSHVALV